MPALRTTGTRDLAALAGALGYCDGGGEGASGRLLQDYRRATRRARAVMEQVFYDG